MTYMNKSFLHFVILAAICIAGPSWSSKALAHTDTIKQMLHNPFGLPPVRESDIIIPEHFDDELSCPNGTFPYDNCHGISTYEDCQSIDRFTCKPYDPLNPDLFDPFNPDLKPRRWSPADDQVPPGEPGLLPEEPGL